jgi:hypothetical protein
VNSKQEREWVRRSVRGHKQAERQLASKTTGDGRETVSMRQHLRVIRLERHRNREAVTMSMSVRRQLRVMKEKN